MDQITKSELHRIYENVVRELEEKNTSWLDLSDGEYIQMLMVQKIDNTNLTFDEIDDIVYRWLKSEGFKIKK